MYSTTEAKNKQIGWRRCGDNIIYFKNDDSLWVNHFLKFIYEIINWKTFSANNSDSEDESGSYTLTFNIEFQYENDTVYFAHSYPYTYTELQDYLMEIQRHPVKSKFCKLRLLCRSLAGNNIYYLTVTAPSTEEDTIKVSGVFFLFFKKYFGVLKNAHEGKQIS